jgi:hypothetical protein
MNDRAKPGQPVPAGLCASCIHAREVVSARGSRFVRCGLSDVNPRFPKYPPLPVVACDGHARRPDPGRGRKTGYD